MSDNKHCPVCGAAIPEHVTIAIGKIGFCNETCRYTYRAHHAMVQ